MTANQKKIGQALISVYHKEGLEPIVKKLAELGVALVSTGGTFDYIRSLGLEVTAVEELTTFPSIFGGRVKTLHPAIFGGILYRRNEANDLKEAEQYKIPPIDLVIVDLYPFEETVSDGKPEPEIIEKIDIGGISLIRAAAKNFDDVLIVPSRKHYSALLNLLETGSGHSTLEERRKFATYAFVESSHYDSAIYNFFNQQEKVGGLRFSLDQEKPLRYGENPHQQGFFYGDLDACFTQLHGKELSYNNLVDIDAALQLIDDFDSPAFAVIKHTNACGAAMRDDLLSAWKDALAGDPVSAFGGVLVANRLIDEETAQEINKIFFEVLIAPDYEKNALEILKQKKNRVLLQRKEDGFFPLLFKTLLNGMIAQDRDVSREGAEQLKQVTEKTPNASQIEDLLFANILVKHTKSNAIVLVKNKQLIGSGIGQTSRVDALRQAVIKARAFGFETADAVMASDAFFPFPDCVEIAHEEGISAVIQPGGSIRDQESVDSCNKNGLAMVITGVRHFKH